MLQKMASKSIILLAIFLVVASKVYSYEEDLKIVVNFANPSAPSVLAPPVKPSPTPPSPVKTPPTTSPNVKAPPSPVKTPPTTSPNVKAPPSPVKTPPTTSPNVKAPPSPVKTPPTTSPNVKAPPSPPLAKTTPPPVTAPTQPPTSQPPIANTPPAPPTPVVKSWRDCLPLCGYRCQLHSRKNLCLRACVTCCNRCKCVPPGTYGNREKCGKCYTDMLTRGNRYKCP